MRDFHDQIRPAFLKVKLIGSIGYLNDVEKCPAIFFWPLCALYEGLPGFSDLSSGVFDGIAFELGKCRLYFRKVRIAPFWIWRVFAQTFHQAKA